MDPKMTRKTEIDLRDIARVVASGTASYLAVHVLLLPQLVRWGVGFPTYFYIGVLATGALSVAVSLLARPRPDAQCTSNAAAPQMHPAE